MKTALLVGCVLVVTLCYSWYSKRREHAQFEKMRAQAETEKLPKLPANFKIPEAGCVSPFRIVALDGKRYLPLFIDETCTRGKEGPDGGSYFTYDEQDGLSLAFKNVSGLHLDGNGQLRKESWSYPANVKAFIEPEENLFIIKLKKDRESKEYFLTFSKDGQPNATPNKDDAQQFLAEYIPEEKVSEQDYIQFTLKCDEKVLDSSSFIEEKHPASAQNSDWILADGYLRPASSPKLILTAVEEKYAVFQDLEHDPTEMCSRPDCYVRSNMKPDVIPQQRFQVEKKPHGTIISIILNFEKYYLSSDGSPTLKLVSEKDYSDPQYYGSLRFRITEPKPISKAQFKAITEGYIIPKAGDLHPFRIVVLDEEKKFTFRVDVVSVQRTDIFDSGAAFTYDKEDGLSLAFRDVLGFYLDDSGWLKKEDLRHPKNVKASIEPDGQNFLIKLKKIEHENLLKKLKKTRDDNEYYLKCLKDRQKGVILRTTKKKDDAQKFLAEFIPQNKVSGKNPMQFTLAHKNLTINSVSLIEEGHSYLVQDSNWILADDLLRPASLPDLVLTAVKEEGAWHVVFRKKMESAENNGIIPEQRFEVQLNGDVVIIKIWLENQEYSLNLISDIAGLFYVMKLVKLLDDSRNSDSIRFTILDPKCISNAQFRAIYNA